MIITCLIVGTIIGLTSSFLAVGGGIFIVPALVTVLGIERHQAIATSLVVIFFLSLTNAIRFQLKGRIDFRFGLLLGVSAATGAFVAGLFGLKFSGDTLGFLYAGILSVVAVQAFRGERSRLSQFLTKRPQLKKYGVPVIGAAAGVASALTGISGGIVMTPYVTASNWVEQPKVVPSVTLAMTCSSLAGASAYMISSSGISFVLFDIALLIFAAAAVSSTLGQKYQHQLSPRTRGWLLGTILLALIAQTLYQIFST